MLVVLYRPPKSRIQDFVAEIAELIGSGVLLDKYIICGDLNCPGAANSRGLIHDELRRMIDEQNLTQHVDQPTCRSGNILDHILTPDDMNLVRDTTVTDVGLSDHSLITCKIVEPVHRAPVVKMIFRCWKRLDINIFRQRLLSSNSYKNPLTTVDSFADQIKSDIIGILDDLIPIHEVTKRVSKLGNGWLSDEAKVAKRERRQLERKWKSTGYEAVRQAYRHSCKVANLLITESRRCFYAKRVRDSSSDPRKLWQTVKGILHTNRSSCETQPGLCNAFAAHIVSKIDKVKSSVTKFTTQMVSRTIQPERRASVTPLELFTPTTEAEVMRVIARLPNKTSPLDYVHTSVVKSCADAFAPLIARIINLSFDEGRFPDSFKMAQVTPLIKKAGLDESDPSNYRPISNLNTIGKIIERICLVRLLPHVASTNNFSPLQSAYRKKHSTETALLKVLDDLYRIMDSKHAAVLIGLDLSAAFDTINHGMLLERLRNMFGVTGTALGWIQSYLSNRTQYVKIGSEQSSISQVSVGVPQGSVLGPFLFSVYVSPVADIIASFDVQHHQYADDTQLYTAVKSGVDSESIKKLEQCSRAVRDWYAINGMLLNPDKSEVLLVARKSIAKTFAGGSGVAVAGSNITFSVKLKSLGVTLDQNLSFDNHVQNIVKASKYTI